MEKNGLLALNQEKRTTADEVQDLIQRLHTTSWDGSFTVGMSPTSGTHHVTKPIQRIFEIGAPAQELLLQKLPDAKIQEQLIFLLGGIGDEKAIPAIINSMVEEKNLRDNPNAKRINFIANVALTNLTAADVFFPKSGGNIIYNCNLEESKFCWQRWWRQNASHFTTKTVKDADRMFQCYPSYGIYRMKNNNSTYYDFDAQGKPRPVQDE